MTAIEEKNLSSLALPPQNGTAVERRDFPERHWGVLRGRRAVFHERIFWEGRRAGKRGDFRGEFLRQAPGGRRGDHRLRRVSLAPIQRLGNVHALCQQDDHVLDCGGRRCWARVGRGWGRGRRSGKLGDARPGVVCRDCGRGGIGCDGIARQYWRQLGVQGAHGDWRRRRWWRDADQRRRGRQRRWRGRSTGHRDVSRRHWRGRSPAAGLQRRVMYVYCRWGLRIGGWRRRRGRGGNVQEQHCIRCRRSWVHKFN